MPANLRIRDVERIVVDVPFTPRCQQWNAPIECIGCMAVFDGSCSRSHGFPWK